MYRELDAARLRALLRIDEDQLPGVLIVMGERHVQRAASRMAAYLEDPHELRATPGYLCRYKGLGVAVVGAFGAAMAGNYVHLWCGAGVPVVFQLGWFGAFQHGMDAGDVVVPHHAAREDGVSDWYLPKGIRRCNARALLGGRSTAARAWPQRKRRTAVHHVGYVRPIP